MKKSHLKSMITNDEELVKKGLWNKKTFLIVSLTIITIIFFLSTTLELNEDKAKRLWAGILIFVLVIILLFYYNYL